MRSGSNIKRLYTTVGDLIVAITDAALEVSKNEKEAYRVAHLVLSRMVSPSAQKLYRKPGVCSREWLQ